MASRFAVCSAALVNARIAKDVARGDADVKDEGKDDGKGDAGFDSVEELELRLRLHDLPAELQRLWAATRAKRSDLQSQFMIGYHFDVGIAGVNSVNTVTGAADVSASANACTTQATYWYRRAADRGHTIAQLNLGVLHETGHQGARRPDLAAAVQWYYRAAAGGHVGAQFNLGRLFWSGKGVPKNYTTAFAFFRKAARGGHDMAMTNVGAMYMFGNGVAIDMVEARRWSLLAAAKSNAVAHHNLGVMCENALGGPVDLIAAATHFRRALDPAVENTVDGALSATLRANREPLIFT